MNPLITKLQERVKLFDSLQEADKGQWGIMTPQHMVEHLGMLIYETSIGKGIASLVIPEDQVAKMKGRFFSAYYPIPKNVKMPGTQDEPTVLFPLRYASLEEAKEKLNGAVTNFLAQYESHPEQVSLHGYFGELTMEEWLAFHIKHMEHHLMQFGVLPAADEKITQLEKLLYKVYTKVSADATAKWGKMNAHQMIEHLGLVFVLSTGKFDLPYKGTTEDAAKYWAAFQEAPAPWKTVFPATSFGEPKPPRAATIEASKAGLQKTFQKYLAYCEANPSAVNSHFFLGNLTVDQWRQVHVKHLEHHLRQFGVLEDIV